MDVSIITDLVRSSTLLTVWMLATIVLIVYFQLAWFIFGRDPKKDTVIPIYTPPRGLSPAALRYVWQMAPFVDHIGFMASVLDLAAKDRVELFLKKGIFTLKSVKPGKRRNHRKSGSAVQTEELPEATLDDEDRLMAALFREGSHVSFHYSHKNVIANAMEQLQNSFISQYRNQYFDTNHSSFIAGIFIAAMGIYWIAGAINHYSDFYYVGITTATVILVVIFWSVPTQNRNVIDAFRLLSGFFFLVAIHAVFSAEFSPVSLFLVISTVLLLYLYYYLLKAPTPEGQKLLEEIEGFRLYLETAEMEILNSITPPTETEPGKIHRYLPYALALGVKQQWAETFAEIQMAQLSLDAETKLLPSQQNADPFNLSEYASAVGKREPHSFDTNKLSLHYWWEFIKLHALEIFIGVGAGAAAILPFLEILNVISMESLLSDQDALIRIGAGGFIGSVAAIIIASVTMPRRTPTGNRIYKFIEYTAWNLLLSACTQMLLVNAYLMDRENWFEEFFVGFWGILFLIGAILCWVYSLHYFAGKR